MDSRSYRAQKDVDRSFSICLQTRFDQVSAALDAIERIHIEMAGVSIETFEANCASAGWWSPALKSFPKPTVV
jgi:hypothetical protein